MMDQYVTFGDLLKICSVLLSLANLIAYIYYNHKHSNQHHHEKKKKQPPTARYFVAVISLTKTVGAYRLLGRLSFYFIIIHRSRFVKGGARKSQYFSLFL